METHNVVAATVVQDTIEDLVTSVENDELGWIHLQVGDQICVPRWGGLFYHHGVYVGSNKVLHFAGNPWTGLGLSTSACMVKIDTLPNFVGSASKTYKIHLVNRATNDRTDFERHTGVMSYNVLDNNCEHFASRVSTGKSHSFQINRVVVATVMLLCFFFPKAVLSTTAGFMLVKGHPRR